MFLVTYVYMYASLIKCISLSCKAPWGPNMSTHVGQLLKKEINVATAVLNTMQSM